MTEIHTDPDPQHGFLVITYNNSDPSLFVFSCGTAVFNALRDISVSRYIWCCILQYPDPRGSASFLKKPNPDRHLSQKSDPNLHQSLNSIAVVVQNRAMETHLGALEANSGAVKGL
jgi:hypothetical protein